MMMIMQAYRHQHQHLGISEQLPKGHMTRLCRCKISSMKHMATTSFVHVAAVGMVKTGQEFVVLRRSLERMHGIGLHPTGVCDAATISYHSRMGYRNKQELHQMPSHQALCPNTEISSNAFSSDEA
jgi:hypothetical protein